MKNFEVLWYETSDNFQDAHTESFRTRKQALKFYEEHKNDEDKTGWWVTRRDSDGYVIEDIIW